MSKKRIRLSLDGKTPMPTTHMPAATGPWLGEHDSEQRHRATMRMYALEDERVRAANGGRMPSFATTMNQQEGSAVFDEPPPRQLDDPLDERHSPELVGPDPTLADTYDLAELHKPRGVTFEDDA